MGCVAEIGYVSSNALGALARLDETPTASNALGALARLDDTPTASNALGALAVAQRHLLARWRSLGEGSLRRLN